MTLKNCLAHQPEDKSKSFVGLAIKLEVEKDYLKHLFFFVNM